MESVNSEDISLEDLLKQSQVDASHYHKALRFTKSGKQVILQRQPSERWINQYNPDILRTWGANMDIQFITDPYACITYVTSYMLKTERTMSELLKKVADQNKDDDISRG